jgi:hypothetical protein
VPTVLPPLPVMPPMPAAAPPDPVAAPPVPDELPPWPGVPPDPVVPPVPAIPGSLCDEHCVVKMSDARRPAAPRESPALRFIKMVLRPE